MHTQLKMTYNICQRDILNLNLLVSKKKQWYNPRELYEQTAGWRKTFSTVLVIDPRGKGHRFDPLAGMTTEDELYSVATDLLHVPNEGDSAIFTLRAIDMLTYIFMAARDEGHPPFSYGRQILRRGALAAIERLQAVNPDYATGFLDVPPEWANLKDQFMLHSFGTLKARLKSNLTETVVRTLSGSDFTAKDIITADKPVTVYCKWPEAHKHK